MRTDFRRCSISLSVGLFSLAMGCCSGGEDVDSEDAKSAAHDSDLPVDDTDQGHPTDTGSNDSGESDEVPIGEYCEFNDPELANCDPDRNYDPWIAGTGEVHYWIRDKKTEVFPFTTDDHPSVWYGYLQLTSPEVARDVTEDLFHIWFSETPNGPPIEGDDCDKYTTRGDFYVYWTFKEEDPLLDGVCVLGEYPRLMYVNFETRCHPDYFEGLCDDDNKNKSDSDYQFDVSRRVSSY